jgi:hypothetical protein
MRGGLGTSNDESEGQSLHLSDLDVSDQSNISNNDQPADWENSGFSGDTTINSNDWSIGQQNLPQVQTQPNFGNIDHITPVNEGDNFFDVGELNLEPDEDENLNQSAESVNTTMEDNSLSFGGKRKSKRRTSTKKTKKTKKTRKTRKNKKRKHRGGGFTTLEITNPISYKEDEYDQFKNALNYNPSKQ